MAGADDEQVLGAAAADAGLEEGAKGAIPVPPANMTIGTDESAGSPNAGGWTMRIGTSSPGRAPSVLQRYVEAVPYRRRATEVGDSTLSYERWPTVSSIRSAAKPSPAIDETEYSRGSSGGTRRQRFS